MSWRTVELEVWMRAMTCVCVFVCVCVVCVVFVSVCAFECVCVLCLYACVRLSVCMHVNVPACVRVCKGGCL
jgi:hypothetical protein